MNNQEQLLKKEVFEQIYQLLKVPKTIDQEYIYQLYCTLIPEIMKLIEASSSSPYNIINPMILLNYIVSEYLYSVNGLTAQELEAMNENPTFNQKIASIILDKYFTNEKLGYVLTPTETKFYPPISSLTLYLNFILNSLSSYQKGDPERTLIVDFLQKGFTLAKGIISLLTQGFETEAFSLWRTFHEIECIIKILTDNGAEVIRTYLRHMDYGFAFRNIYADKEKQDQVFVEIKEKMRAHELKSKDMKKFIEYGWLYEVSAHKDYPNFKLNFRDGVEELAGLSIYSKWYEMSSEIAHSSPLLIYSNKKFFYDLTFLATLESFLRLENVFNNIYMTNVDAKSQEGYKFMRNTYKNQLIIIHELENNRFKKEHKLL